MNETRSDQARRVANQLQGKDWVKATFEAADLLRIMAKDAEAARAPGPAADLEDVIREALEYWEAGEDKDWIFAGLRDAIAEHEAAAEGGRREYP